MKQIYRIIAVTISALLLFSSCNNDEPTPAPQPGSPCDRTVLVYMVATNSLGLGGYDRMDMSEMRQAMSQYTEGKCRLLIYHAAYNKAPLLLEIKNNGIGKTVTDTLKTYPYKVRASVTKSRFSEVINDVISEAPADDYGLVLWSHSEGWARNLTKSRASIRDFGEDSGAKMPLDSLADVLPDKMFSFIHADVCYMGAIETAYQLRNKTDYFIAYPTEIPGYGMPYDENIPCFFEKSPNLLQACKNTYNYYAAQSGAMQSLTIALVDCSKLEALASVCKNIISSAKELTSLDGMQYYNMPSETHIFFDFGQYADSISTDTSLNAEFHNALNEAVAYKACTQYIVNKLYIDSNKFSGLSTYILGTGSETNEEYYKTLDWYKAVY